MRFVEDSDGSKRVLKSKKVFPRWYRAEYVEVVSLGGQLVEKDGIQGDVK